MLVIIRNTSFLCHHATNDKFYDKLAKNRIPNFLKNMQVRQTLNPVHNIIIPAAIRNQK